jgi:hypothetical protein
MCNETDSKHVPPTFSLGKWKILTKKRETGVGSEATKCPGIELSKITTIKIK